LIVVGVQNCAEMADATERSIVPLVRADHFDAAMKTARRSVSPQDVLKYQEFARTLAQWRGLPSTHASVYVPSTYLHTSTPPLSFFTGRMPFLPPKQQRQSTEGVIV